MSRHTPVIEHAVLAAMNSANVDKTLAVTVTTEVLQIVDSLGLFAALANIQDALDISLDPPQILQIFRCQSIGDVISTLDRFIDPQNLKSG